MLCIVITDIKKIDHLKTSNTGDVLTRAVRRDFIRRTIVKPMCLPMFFTSRITITCQTKKMLLLLRSKPTFATSQRTSCFSRCLRFSRITSPATTSHEMTSSFQHFKVAARKCIEQGEHRCHRFQQLSPKSTSKATGRKHAQEIPFF